MELKDISKYNSLLYENPKTVKLITEKGLFPLEVYHIKPRPLTGEEFKSLNDWVNPSDAVYLFKKLEDFPEFWYQSKSCNIIPRNDIGELDIFQSFRNKKNISEKTIHSIIDCIEPITVELDSIAFFNSLKLDFLKCTYSKKSYDGTPFSKYDEDTNIICTKHAKAFFDHPKDETSVFEISLIPYEIIKHNKTEKEKNDVINQLKLRAEPNSYKSYSFR